MCEACYDALGRPDRITPAVRAAVPLVGALDYRFVPGTLTAILGDWQIDDDALRHVKVPSAEDGACRAALLALSADERATTMAIVEGLLTDPLA